MKDCGLKKPTNIDNQIQLSDLCIKIKHIGDVHLDYR